MRQVLPARGVPKQAPPRKGRGTARAMPCTGRGAIPKHPRAEIRRLAVLAGGERPNIQGVRLKSPQPPLTAPENDLHATAGQWCAARAVWRLSRHGAHPRARGGRAAPLGLHALVLRCDFAIALFDLTGDLHQ